MHEVPHLTVVVTWQADAVPAEFTQASPPTARRSDKPDPTNGPDERQRAQFQTIREWRSETARAERGTGLRRFDRPPTRCKTMRNRVLTQIHDSRAQKLTLASAAVLAGRRSYAAVAQWVADVPQDLLEALGCIRDKNGRSRRLAARLVGQPWPVYHPRFIGSESDSGGSFPVRSVSSFVIVIVIGVAGWLPAQSGSYSYFGSSCFNQRSEFMAQGVPTIGVHLIIDMPATVAFPSGTQTAFLITGTSNSTWGPLRLPFNVAYLSGAGTIFCGDIQVSFDIVSAGPRVGYPSSRGVVRILIPNDAQLLGQSFYNQVLTQSYCSRCGGLWSYNLSRGGHGTVGR